jgi:NAD(P)-dependent dehydrogenase (short-subunit alcohol dehydrogenase family)
VNNAGAGFCHGADKETIIRTNFYGPKNINNYFIPLLDPTIGRIVNMGSGAGPNYVS